MSRVTGVLLGAWVLALSTIGCASDAALRTNAPSEPTGALPASQSKPPSAAHPYQSCAGVRGDGEHGLIDDFEDADWQIASVDRRAGVWFTYNDSTAGAFVREVANVGGSRVAHVTAAGFTKWGAGLGTGLGEMPAAATYCSYDASAYSAVRLRAKGNGRVRVRLGTPDNLPPNGGGRCSAPGEACYDWPGFNLALEEKWRTYTLPFCALTSEGWGRRLRGLDASQLAELHFLFQGDVEMWLDDVALVSADKQSATADASECRSACPLQLAPTAAKLHPERTFLNLPAQVTVHTFEQPTTSCGSITRRYLSSVPPSLGVGTSAPILFALHGSGANAESFQHTMMFGELDELASRKGFIVVYGNAAPGEHSGADPRFPNTGSWRQDYYDDEQVDDVDYLFRVVDDLKRRGVVSGSNPLYLTGVSNGGGMVLKAAREAPTRFSGIAPFMAFDGKPPAPVPSLLGTALQRILFVYSQNDPGLFPGYSAVLREQEPVWARALGFPESAVQTPRQTELPDRIIEGEHYLGKNAVALATRDSHATQLDFASPGLDAKMRVIRFDHAGHFMPNRGSDPEAWIVNRWGFRNQDVDVSELLWSYLIE